ncbi:MAG TPA: BON domain-containing protein [Longimicrobium sp.]|nr:BON domain-containing protein [Longimicrobium sp.]
MEYERSRLGERGSWERLAYTLGAAGGLALAVALGRAMGVDVRGAGERLRQGAGGLASRLRPGRLRREQAEQNGLLRLEDAVLAEYLADEVLSERGIDVGAISSGIVELSGSVYTRDEARHAVAVAQRVEGVETVVNRLEVDAEAHRLDAHTDEEGAMANGEWTGHRSGMGSRRQGHDTDPARSDDSQHQVEQALDASDRAQFEDEGYGSRPRSHARPEGGEVNPTNYAEDELDNQSPYGKHAVPVPEQPQAMNAAGQIGEGLKPGTELALEAADVPVKPHGHTRPGNDEDRDA